MKEIIKKLLIVFLGSVCLLSAGYSAVGDWTTNSDLPYDINEVSQVVYNGEIYLVGGYEQSSSSRSNKLTKYNPLTDTYVSLSNIPVTKSGSTNVIVTNNGIIYQIAGYDGSGDTNTVYAYNISSDVWTQVSNYPIAVRGVSCVFDKNTKNDIYCFGGYTASDKSINNVYKYDISSDNWIQLNDYPISAQIIGSDYYNGEIYLVGGYTTGAVDNCYKYDISSDTYTTISSIPYADRSHGVKFGENNLLYMVGGRSGSTYYDDVYVYNISSNNWNFVTNIPITLAYIDPSFINGNMYIIGGYDSSNTLTSNYKYEAYILSLTPTINYNIQNWYNTKNISINLTTESNTNMSYILDNNNEILICSDCNQTTLQLTNLSEGSHSILFESKDSNGVTNTTANFTIDTLKPIINNNLQNYTSYSINGFNSSCNDLNLDYCNITLDNQTVSLNISNFTFTHNGNITYLIEAKDLAGNKINQTGTIFINPKAYFRFYDNVRSKYVTSYTFGSYSSNNTYIEIPIYDLGLGSHSLEFVGFGFKTQNYIFNFTNTSIINQTFNITPAVLTIKAYDESTLTALTNFDIQIKNGTSIKTYTGVNNLNLYSDNSSTLLGSLEITISKSNYTSRVYSINLDAYSVVNLNAYLLPTTKGAYIDFFVYDNNNKVVENALISIYQTINASDTVIEQIYTDGAGYGGVFIDPTKQNQYFLVLKDGFVQQQYDIRPTTSEYKVYLKTLTDTWEPWNSGVTYNIEKFSSNTEPLNLTFTITNQNNDFTLWGFKVYDENNILIDTLQSTANSGGSLSYIDSNNHSKLKLNYFYQIGTNVESFSKIYYYHFVSYNFTSVNVINMGEDFVQTDEIPNEGKAILFLISLIFIMAIPNAIPEAKGKGAGLFLGWAWVLYYSYIGGLHWGLTAMAIIGTALINFDKKAEGRL